MMTLIEIMARSVGARPQQNKNCDVEYLMDAGALGRLVELVRAEERNIWPAEMEAMERQVNILTDALAQAKAEEREAIAQSLDKQADLAADEIDRQWAQEMAAAVRARSNT